MQEKEKWAEGNITK